jgi:hypothetical protein
MTRMGWTGRFSPKAAVDREICVWSDRYVIACFDPSDWLHGIRAHQHLALRP